jgi:hypothetical protein
MARAIRMPSEEELPPGSVRSFVIELFDLYREAHRPPLRLVSATVERLDHPGTASPETIRRMLNGTTVPAHWPAVEAVLLAFCELSGRNPNAEYNHPGDRHRTSRRRELESTWHRALDFPDERYTEPAPDPWATDDDDPAF